MRVVFLPRARTDLIRLRKFLEPHGEALAARSYDLLFEAALSLADYPDRGQPATRSLYRQLAAPFGRSAYVIRYRVDHARSTVVIVRIWHGRDRR